MPVGDPLARAVAGIDVALDPDESIVVIGHKHVSGVVEFHELEVQLQRRPREDRPRVRTSPHLNLEHMGVVFSGVADGWDERDEWQRVMDAIDAIEHVPVEVERLARERHGPDADSVIADWVEEHAGITAVDALRYMGIVREMLVIVAAEERPMLGAITLRR